MAAILDEQLAFVMDEAGLDIYDEAGAPISIAGHLSISGSLTTTITISGGI